jgi:hypothetical protein
MPNGSATEFWLPINKEQWRNAPNDLLSLGPVAIPTGCAVQFNLAFWEGAQGDGNLINLGTAYSAIHFRILEPDLSATLIDITIASASFGTCTTAEFIAMANAQLEIFIPALSNVLTATNGAPGNFILQVYGIDSDGASDPDILCQFQVSAYYTGIGNITPATLSTPMTRGTAAIAAGASSGTVALALAYVPTTVIVSIQGPDVNADNFTVTVYGITAASFNFNLSAATDRAGYVLHWMAIQ